MRKHSRKPRLRKPKSILKYITNSLNPKPTTHKHQPKRYIQLHSILHNQDPELPDTLPPGNGIHNSNLNECIQIGQLEQCYQHIIDYESELVLFLFSLIFPLFLLVFQNADALYREIVPRFDIFAFDDRLLLFDLLAAILALLVFLV